MRFESVRVAIGRTPLVRLRFDDSPGVHVYAKLEMQNPFGMKDRVALNVIAEAKRTGVLTDGAPIVESSSGTMALGVALVGRSLGHPVHIVTDPRIDRITMAKLRALGCAVHVVVVTRGAGSEVRVARNAYDRIGYVVATHDRPDDVEQALDRATAELDIVIEPSPLGEPVR